MEALRKNQNKLNWSLIDYKSLTPMVEVLQFGVVKYTHVDENGKTITGRDNWKLGLKQTELQDSMMRHLVAIMSGEEIDPESGLPHIGHLMCNAMFYSYHNIINKEVYFKSQTETKNGI
jgi:hypothetical protein